MSTKSQQSRSEKKTTNTDTIKLSLTKDELEHIRDLMSIVLPPDGEKTISSALASIGRKQVKEGILWKKIADLCIKNKISIGDDAPDFYIDYTISPSLSVYASNGNKSEIEDDED